MLFIQLIRYCLSSLYYGVYPADTIVTVILDLRLELISSLPDCRGLFAVIRVHIVMPGRRARARTSDLYCCVSLDIVLLRRTPASRWRM